MKHSLKEILKYKAPTEDNLEQFKDICDAAIEFTNLVTTHLPQSSDRILFFQKILEATLLAQNAIIHTESKKQKKGKSLVH